MRAARRILIADDSATERLALAQILRHEGFEVIEACDGVQAIELSRSERPDVILMDVVMPQTNGFEATRTISRHPSTKGIPIIIYSGKGEEVDRIWGLRQGARAYLVKPLTAKRLLASIRNLVNNAPSPE
ncbi:MAG: response regulator [Rhodocyclaceae bacterium]|nr:response regulator [Rhodocyclaceae bacterium]